MELEQNNLKKREALITVEIKQADQQLWDNFRSGGLNAYSLIYQRYFFLLYSYGLKICPEREIVKDCIQDLFVHIWKNRENLSATTSIKYYLFKSLKRKLIDNFSYNARYTLLPESHEDFFFASVNSEEQNLVIGQLAKEQEKHIAQAMAKLTKRQKEAVILKFYENLPNEDIASKMSISIEGVYNLVSKALNKFRQNLSKAYWLLLLMANL